MKFRFYIANTHDGIVQGTNDEEQARSLAGAEEYFVVDVETGMWLMSSGEDALVEELESSSSDPNE